MLRRQAFASLQHGFLRSVENVFIHNFVTPNGVWENAFLYNIDTHFLLLWLLGRSYALLCHWQMLFAFWNVADVVAKRKMLSSYFCVTGRCCCHIFCGRCYTTLHYVASYCIGWCYCQMADGIATYFYYYFVMADVIAQWQMEIPQLFNFIWWQVFLPSGTWNGHCKVVVIYHLVDVIPMRQMDVHGCTYFSFSSEVLCRTLFHMWGRWYLPMFLFRDELFTLMNNAFIHLQRFWSSLPTILEFYMVTLWPVMLQWS